jgi:hypothetical protein
MMAHFEQANGGFYDGAGRSADAPLSTITTAGSNQQLVTAYFVKYYGNEKDGIRLDEPMHTIPTKDRFGLVQIVQVPLEPWPLNTALERSNARTCCGNTSPSTSRFLPTWCW